MANPRLPEDVNLGTRRIVNLPEARFPSADAIVRERALLRNQNSKVDVLLVNPPAPDGAIWIRSQHRVGRRSRENMIWPQVSLAQLAALLVPDYTVKVVDAIAERMSWADFEKILRDQRARFYVTQVTAPTLTNDMYGCLVAKSLDAVTIAFGTHVTPMAGETLRQYPVLDFALIGEPELTLRELIDLFAVRRGRWTVDADGRLWDKNTQQEAVCHAFMRTMWMKADPTWKPAWVGSGDDAEQLGSIKGLGWREGSNVRINPNRPFIRDLDDLPIPLHELLPIQKYRAPLIRGAYSFIVTSRGCPAGCTYCIKHVSYQYSVRLRSPEKLVEEMELLKRLGARHVHMYADLFTVNREQVVRLCELMIERNLQLDWTCNSRVDYVDEEMLRLMGKAGCQLISWGIESGNEMILKKVRKGYRMEQAKQALMWARKAGIKNWGYFIIGLPGETEETIRQTIDLAKSLPLDIALFHVAAPYPGTPFFFQAVENNWFRPGVNWEEVDMDQATVLDYDTLKAEDLLAWQKRAFREWALRPAPILTFLKGMNSWQGFLSAVDVALQTFGWIK